MLLRFTVSNFLSISEEIEFNMFPGDYRRHEHHIYHTEQVDLLKSAAIYGANGAGKSNLVKALSFLHELVITGKMDYQGYLYFKLDKQYAEQPTNMEIEFRYNKKYYAYGISILKDKILEEWLYELDIKKEKESLLFERKLNNNKPDIKTHPALLKTEKDKYRLEIYTHEILQEDTPFIYLVHDKEGFEKIFDAYKWFENCLLLIYPEIKYKDFLHKIALDVKFRDFVNKIMAETGTGVAEIDVNLEVYDIFFDESRERTKQDILARLEAGESSVLVKYDDYNAEKHVVVSFNKNQELIVHQIILKHKNDKITDVSFGMEEESDGTQRLLEFLPAWDMLYNNEVVFIIDEIDRSLHPALLKKLVEQFLKAKTKGQLVFTTHESNLLDMNLFRQDEIWFTEKDNSGSTKIYPLSDFKPRYDLDIRKGYLNGRFGAIPFLGNLNDLNWEYAEKEQTL